MCRKLILAFTVAALALLFGVAPIQVAEASDLYIVDDDYTGPGTGCEGAGYATIQDALAVTNADKSRSIRIQVCPGLYDDGQVIIDSYPKTVILEAVYPYDGINPSNWAQLFVPVSGANGGALVRVIDSPKVTVRGFFVSGGSHFNDMADPLWGVYYYNSGGKIIGHRVEEIRTTGHQGYGTAIGVFSNVGGKVTIQGNSLEHYQNAGIAVRGRVKAKIAENLVQGPGHVSYTNPVSFPDDDGPYGIALIQTSKAKVTENEVNSHIYIGAVSGVLGAGIAIVESTRAKVQKNLLQWNDVGVGVNDECDYDFDHPELSWPADFNKIASNQIINTDESYVGIGIEATDPGSGACDLLLPIPSASFNQVKGNTILSGAGDTDMGVGLADWTGAIALENQVKGNIFDGFALADTIVDWATETIIGTNTFLNVP
jgi:hypothetical protein